MTKKEAMKLNQRDYVQFLDKDFDNKTLYGMVLCKPINYKNAHILIDVLYLEQKDNDFALLTLEHNKVIRKVDQVVWPNY